MKANQEAMMRDPVVRLEKELAHALDEEDFYRASGVKKELDLHLHHRQLVVMKRERLMQVRRLVKRMKKVEKRQQKKQSH